MRFNTVIALMTTGMLCGAPALASEHLMSVTGLEVVNDGTYDMVVATGTFSPALPCLNQGFWIYPTESKYKGIYALLLTAKATGSTVKISHAYCHENGYSRSNRFRLQ